MMEMLVTGFLMLIQILLTVLTVKSIIKSRWILYICPLVWLLVQILAVVLPVCRGHCDGLPGMYILKVMGVDLLYALLYAFVVFYPALYCYTKRAALHAVILVLLWVLTPYCATGTKTREYASVLLHIHIQYDDPKAPELDCVGFWNK